MPDRVYPKIITFQLTLAPSMRPFISVIVVVYLVSYSLSGQTKQLTHEAAENPNIIFILTDDQRFDALGHAQNPYVNTPHMDTLAMRGVYFPNAMVSTPICAGSRASILTGVYERSHGYDFSVKRIHASYMADSYPALLKKNGYRTAFYGKFGVRYDSLSTLFDTFEVYDRKSSETDRRGYFYKQQGGDTVHLTKYTGNKPWIISVTRMGKNPSVLPWPLVRRMPMTIHKSNISGRKRMTIYWWTP